MSKRSDFKNSVIQRASWRSEREEDALRHAVMSEEEIEDYQKKLRKLAELRRKKRKS
jgi:hypothetical protein